LALGFAPGSVPGTPSNPTLIDSASARFARTLHALETADYADRMNSTSWAADNPTLDHFYARKAASVEALIQRLQDGKSVSSGEVAQALDNSAARRLGGW
jgi:hypothetical protein